MFQSGLILESIITLLFGVALGLLIGIKLRFPRTWEGLALVLTWFLFSLNPEIVGGRNCYFFGTHTSADGAMSGIRCNEFLLALFAALAISYLGRLAWKYMPRIKQLFVRSV